jgi:hypothetical protein
LAAGNIVHGKTTIVNKLSLRTAIADLGNTLVSAVPCLEVHGRRPVVGLVLGETARRASGSRSEIE